ncbi:hypothetical protein CDAR_107131 [Caerostris darwini]|uniref:Uncharacterized protein n=1 Tax=Caerostris darwini TaxID=1538125 RepID=A0AAV4SWX7_9ARAC|nr:hypothetical protein CDAR_107131 [Caerostris darwini]
MITIKWLCLEIGRQIGFGVCVMVFQRSGTNFGCFINVWKDCPSPCTTNAGGLSDLKRWKFCLMMREPGSEILSPLHPPFGWRGATDDEGKGAPGARCDER